MTKGVALISVQLITHWVQLGADLYKYHVRESIKCKTCKKYNAYWFGHFAHDSQQKKYVLHDHMLLSNLRKIPVMSWCYFFTGNVIVVGILKQLLFLALPEL